MVGETIKIAVTWANPHNDIPGLQQHLKNLQSIAASNPQELAIIGPLEFVSVESTKGVLAEEHPHVFYHIGHAFQRGEEKVKLLIGANSAPTECDVEQFRALLQVIGPPRLLLLNACAAAIGYSLNPYLGAALSCASEIDAVIAMQTMVPAAAAMQFANGLFRSLAKGKGLAESVKRGLMTTPVTLIDGEVVVGFDQGRLSKLLGVV
jgi:hypothetical protein